MGSRENATDRDVVSVLLGADKRYRLLRRISRDELGTLWDAEDTSLKCAVTVRMLTERFTADPGRIEEFHSRMSAVAGRLDHPTIAYVFYYSEEEEGSDQFVVMEPLSGEILARRLRRAGALDPEVAFRIAAEIAEGLQAAHDLGLSHGGLTAASVMLTSEGSVKLLDFGAASLMEPRSGRRPVEERDDAAALGVSGRAEGPPGDVYQLGMILRQMLAGRGSSTATPVESEEARLPRSKPRRKGRAAGSLQGREWEAALDPDPAARPSAARIASMLQHEVAEERSRRGNLETEEARASEGGTAKEVAKLRERARVEAEGAPQAEPDAPIEAQGQTAEELREYEEAGAPQEDERAGVKARGVEQDHQAEETRDAGDSTPSEGARDADIAAKAEKARRQEEARLKREARRALAEGKKVEAAWIRAVETRQKESVRLRDEEARRREEARGAVDEARNAQEALRQARQTARREKARLQEAARLTSGRAETVARELEEGLEALKAEVARLAADEARSREEARAATQRARSAIKQAEQADTRLRGSGEALQRAETQLEAEVRKAAAEGRKIEEARLLAEETERTKATELEAEEARLTDEAERAAAEAKAAENAGLRAEQARMEEETRLQAEEAELQARAKAVTEMARIAVEEARKAEVARRDAQASIRGQGRHRRNWSLRKRDAPTPDPPSASPEPP
jgi:hypothetical protein